MAWIKMRTDLRDDPAVIAMAAQLDLTEDHIVGLLHRLWVWANQQTTDGNASGVTKKWVDRYIGVSGFAENLESVGWLDCSSGSVTIPKFDRHNSESAKRRALTAERVRRHRVTQEPLPEKRREEKKKPPIIPPTLDQIRAYCLERKNTVDPERFLDHYTANGWVQGRGKPIKDWKACVRTWEKNSFDNDSSDKPATFHVIDKPKGPPR